MLKSISNLGNVLNKSEQREINGGILQCPDHTVYTCIGIPPMVSCWCQSYLQPGDDFVR